MRWKLALEGKDFSLYQNVEYDEIKEQEEILNELRQQVASIAQEIEYLRQQFKKRFEEQEAELKKNLKNRMQN